MTDWAFAATPLGFYVGCLRVMPLFLRPRADVLPQGSPRFEVSTAFAAVFVAFAIWRAPGAPGRPAWRCS